MSAPLHKLVKRKLWSFYNRESGLTFRRNYSNAKCTYVLIPEVPPDTAETNTLMDVKNFPDWSKITSSSTYRGCGKLAILFETHLAEHCEKLKDFGKASNFDDIFTPIEEVSVPLQNAHWAVKNLSTVKKKTFSDAYEGIFTHVHKSRAERLSNEILYHKIKELNSNPAALTESQQSLVSKYLRECKQAGVELTGKTKNSFMDHWKSLAQSQDQFRRSVYFASKIFQHTVYDSNAVSEMPESVRNRLSASRDRPEEGPWLFGVSSYTTYQPVLDYCPNRELRKKVWQELVSIASITHTTQGFNNKEHLMDIRQCRRSMAQMLGHSSYAEMVMQHRMAGSVHNVMEFIETLRSAFQPEAQEEIDLLHKYASSHGFSESMHMWDVDYWSRRQCSELYNVSLSEPSEYFPLPRVLDGLFQICRALFGVDIKPCKSEIPVWHPSVQVYDVFDEDGSERGTFFLDPYTRLGEKYAGGWIERGRERSSLYQCNPTTYLNLNLGPPLGKQPALMSIQDVSLLFTMMGHTLQQLVTTVDYSEVAGQSNIESDAVHVSSLFMVMWLLRPDTLRSLSCHWETTEPLAEDKVHNILAAYNHMYSNQLMKKIFYSVYDLEMHFSEKHFDTAVKQLWPRYMLQPLDPIYMKPFSMTNVFTDDNQASGIYAGLWSEMVAADVFKSFNECTNLEELKTTGRRFKDTILSMGGSAPAIEVFRRFKGHDPSIDSLLQLRLPRQQFLE